MSTIRMILAIVLIAAVAALVVSLCSAENAAAAGLDQDPPPPPNCIACHSEIAEVWKSGKHANAFGDSAFIKAWDEGKNQKYCLTCHTTNYDANTDQYVQEGVGCVSCHKPAGTQSHPGGAMTVSDSAEFCGTCHTTTLHEWQKGGHGKANVACQSCHDMHSTTLRTTNSDDLCSNCHKERNVQAANMPMSGLTQCANCHMFTPVQEKTEGKGATGHSSVMGSDACQKCHKDNIHAAHKIDPTVPPQPGTDKSITPPSPASAQQVAAPAPAAAASSNLPGIAGGALGGMLFGFAAAVVTVRRNQ